MKVFVQPVMHDSTWERGNIDICCTLDDLPFAYMPCVNGVVKRELLLKDVSYRPVFNRLFGRYPTPEEEHARDQALIQNKRRIIEECLHVALRLYPKLIVNTYL